MKDWVKVVGGSILGAVLVGLVVLGSLAVGEGVAKHDGAETGLGFASVVVFGGLIPVVGTGVKNATERLLAGEGEDFSKLCGDYSYNEADWLDDDDLDQFDVEEEDTTLDDDRRVGYDIRRTS